MYRILLIVFASFMFSVLSCGMKTTRLKNGIVRVPMDSRVYENRQKFDSSLLLLINTNAIYEQLDLLDGQKVSVKVSPYNDYCRLIKFYPNGFLNCFILNKSDKINTTTFDPDYDGYRGVYYKEKGKIRYDLFTTVGEYLQFGQESGTIIIRGDTILQHPDRSRITYLYVKSNIPDSLLHHQVQW